MPTYEYICKECGATTEVVQAFTDESLTECATCGGRLRKVFGNVGISFKGSGFYKTDSRSEKKESSSATNGSGESADKTSPEKSSDKSASDAKTETSSPSAGSSGSEPTTPKKESSGSGSGSSPAGKP